MPGFNRKLLLLIFSKTNVLTDEGRSGTDKAHVSFKYAVELGKFIQAVAAHPRTDPCDAGIVRELEHGSLHFIEGFELRLKQFSHSNTSNGTCTR